MAFVWGVSNACHNLAYKCQILLLYCTHSLQQEMCQVLCQFSGSLVQFLSVVKVLPVCILFVVCDVYELALV